VDRNYVVKAAAARSKAATNDLVMHISKERSHVAVEPLKLNLAPSPAWVYAVDFTVSIYGQTFITRINSSASFVLARTATAPQLLAAARQLSMFTLLMRLHSNELYATVLGSAIIGRVLRNRSAFPVTLGAQSPTVDTVFSQPIHNGVRPVAR
jgi:hypothetical protein